MKRLSPSILALMALTALISAGGSYWLAQRHGAESVATAPPGAASGRQVLYWYDPMVPDKHFDQPGKSPFMDMALVPKYADTASASGGVAINPVLTQNLGVRLATAERTTLGDAVEAPASVMFNERDIAVVQTRAAGFVDRVYGRAPGDVVAQGTPLVDVTVPEWASAQAEWLALREAGDKDLARAARDRLRLLGMPEDLVRQLESSGRAQQHFTITAPFAGVIQELDVRQGMTLSPGMTVARVNGLRTVWLEAAVPEAQGGRLKEGQPVTAHFTAFPDQPVTGKVMAVLSDLNMQSRTLRVRMEFPNPGQKLRPGMFAQVSLGSAGKNSLLTVPTEAVIRTGKRNLVLLANADGSFMPVEVTLGQEGQGRTVILDGLQEGQKVVASGQFLIDSEANLSGVLARMSTPSSTPAKMPADTAGAMKPAGAAAAIEATGVIEAMEGRQVTLSHGPIPALDWPAMTMAFPLDKTVSLKGLTKGQRVQFALEKRGEELVIIRLDAEGGPQ